MGRPAEERESRVVERDSELDWIRSTAGHE